jgi:2-oxoglutarate ferredoxin oxidoreductase subunit alpha
LKCQGLYDDSLSIVIGGEAGQGISRSGALLGKALMRSGFHAFGSIDYPSLIRGGHNFFKLRASERKVDSTNENIDILLALNKDSIIQHIEDVVKNGGIIYDEGIELDPEINRDRIKYYPVPLTRFVKILEGPPIMRNTVALGSVSALIGLNKEILKQVVSEVFVGRPKIIKMNKLAIEKGYQFLIDKELDFNCRIESGKKPDRIWLTGNEAISIAAINAGCQFYSAYPMTPASPVLHYMFAHDKKTKMLVIQAENELAAICMAIGAGFTGVRSMTSTSGGGFCLMTEALGFSAMTETPIVIMIGQRTGPSTGLATYSAQADLLFSIYASQGEFQRIVLAPGDVEQSFYLGFEAFNLAEKFQIPVILLGDKTILESHQTTEPFDKNLLEIDRGEYFTEWPSDKKYKRYKFTDSGVSPRAIPGTKNAIILANGNEHIESGHVTSKAKPTSMMVDKRFRKVKHIEEAVLNLMPIRLYGDQDPDITIIGWGSTKGPALETIRLLKNEGIKARFVQPIVLEPFPKQISQYLEGQTILFETNRTSQLGILIKLNTKYEFKNIQLRYDGRPFEPASMRTKIMEVLRC